MSKVLILTVLLTMFESISFAQSIAGIRVGDNVTVLDKLNLKSTAREHLGSTDTVKYKLAIVFAALTKH